MQYKWTGLSELLFSDYNATLSFYRLVLDAHKGALLAIRSVWQILALSKVGDP